MRAVRILIAAGLMVAVSGCGGGSGSPSGPGTDGQGVASASREPAVNREAYSQGPVHQFTVERIDGQTVSLDQYRGQPMLIVNVASECGLTPQYEQLEALYRKHKDQGLVVLGFPSNDFGGQEPGTEEQIQAFCAENYDISFPMFSKVSVTGAGQAPLFAELSKTGGPPTWNFTKYLVGPDGQVKARFDPKTSPQAEEITQQIDALLGS